MLIGRIVRAYSQEEIEELEMDYKAIEDEIAALTKEVAEYQIKGPEDFEQAKGFSQTLSKFHLEIVRYGDSLEAANKKLCAKMDAYTKAPAKATGTQAVCIACGGKKFDTKGGQCKPCRGTGYQILPKQTEAPKVEEVKPPEQPKLQQQEPPATPTFSLDDFDDEAPNEFDDLAIEITKSTQKEFF